MTVLLVVWGVISLVELCMYLPGVWRAHRPIATLLLLAFAAVSGALFTVNPTILSGLVLFAALYRLFNLLRVVDGRRSDNYLRRSAFKTTWTLVLYQLFLLGLVWVLSVTRLSMRTGVVMWIVAVLILAAILLASTLRHLRRMIAPKVTAAYSDKELPSISVCIPARNETEALEACLRSLLESDYPKLEILALDDCSQDRTAEIIRSFAHDGVRFVAGTEPKGTWLAKNWAYQQLYEEANGKLLIFSGVDISWQPETLRALVTTMLSKRKSMMCVIPTNQLVRGGAAKRFSTLLQPMRYGWEISLPRRLFRRPPMLSSCWAAERDLIQKSGSFAAVSNSITPESYMAKAAIEHDGYSFVRSDSDLAVVSLKSLPDQWDTAVRTRYPQLHRRPELVFLLTLLQLGGLVAPIGIFIGSCLAGSWWLAVLSGLTSGMLLLTYCLIVRLTYRRFLWRSLVLSAPAVLLGVISLHYSMVRYEFSDVIWKGRNVCIPVMQIVPRLPRI